MELSAIQICVIAHNEAEHINDCLNSIEQAIAVAKPARYQVHIINNGSTDDTQQVAERFCDGKGDWHPHCVDKGDKANAWNLGLYEYATNSVLTIYIDGDCTMSPNAISAFIEAERANPDAYIFAGIPSTSGRTTEQTIQNTLAGTALSGNLFALSTKFIERTKTLGFKLPVGLIGDDSLLAWVSSHDFKLSNGVVLGFLVGVEGAKFGYHRLTPTSWSNIKLYYRRLTRYSLRHLQQCCIRKHLDKYDDFSTLPEEVEELYVYLSEAFVRKNSFSHKYFDRKAFKKIKP